MNYGIKKLLPLLIILSTIFLTQSCQKDIIGDEDVVDVITTEPTTTVTLSTGVSGMVIDENGNPLEGVTITYSRQNYTTDENGYFKIENIKAGTEGGILAVTQNGYFDNYKFFIPELNTLSFVKVRMIEKGIVQTFATSEGGTIQVEGGGSVEFPANAVEYEGGGEFTGAAVGVYTYWYNPEDPFISQTMPGDLRALSAEGDIVQLATYGMMAVELIDETGRALNLKENTFATIRFPLPQDTRAHAPETIKTWSLNEATVHWEEENVAELVGDEYVAQVSHFSFWNCDAPFPLVNISGKLVNEDGQALSYYNICINALNRGITGYGWSDSEGGFRGKVPKDEPLQFVIKDECGNIAFEQNIGPISNDVSIGEIVIESSQVFIITGQLVCDGDPITTGYARICIDGLNCYIAPVDDQGFFEQAIISCASVSEITVQGFDTENVKSSEIINIDVDASPFSVGIIQVCDELAEFIIFKIDGSTEALITDPAAAIVNGELYIGGEIDSIETIFVATIPSPMEGSDLTVSNIESYLSDDNNFYTAFCTSINACSDISFNITNLGSVGELVEGDFMGEINGQVIMGRFKIIMEEESNPMTCSVEVNAPDCNGNNTGSALIRIQGGVSPFEVTLDGVQTQVINDPEFEFTNLGPGDILVYSVTDANGESCSGEFRVPNNGNLSCDVQVFNPSCGDNNGSITGINGPGGNYIYQWGTGQTTTSINGLSAGLYTYTITDTSTGCTTQCEVELVNDEMIQVFISQQDSILCDPMTSIVDVIATGGTPPYTYDWSDGSNDPQRFGLTDGVYTVIVTDANGCTGVDTREIFFIEGEIVPFVESVLLDCDVNGTPIGIFEVEFVSGGSPPYTYNWSNGSDLSQTEVVLMDEVTLIVEDSNGCVWEQDYVFDPQDHRVIGGIVWEDGPTNAAGSNLNVYDFQDILLEGVEVRLYLAGNTNDPIATTLTNANGVYRFEDIDEGNYLVEVVLTGDYNFVEPNVGQSENLDSEFNADGFAEVSEFDGCVGTLTINAGLRQ